MRIFGKGFNFGQDGPGNRLVYHIQGCNMMCPWCANPEGMPFEGGTEISADEIVRECVRSRAMFFSGGGVTFTGGEATVMHAELLEILRRLGDAGIHRAIETNGSSPQLLSIANEVNYLIMDVKHYDDARHLEFTGVPIKAVRDNLKELTASGRQLHIRIPLINGVNADEPEKFADYLSAFDCDNISVEILPYHEYGKEKWKTEYKISNGFVTKDQIAGLESALQNRGIKIIKT